MEHIFLNLKRFDIPTEYGGVNRLAPIADWGAYIVEQTKEPLKRYVQENVEFAQFFPEAHLISAVKALGTDGGLHIGAQGVLRADTSVGGNFGAFTTGRTANAVKALGCDYVIIGHCEERNNLKGIISEADGTDLAAVDRILNQEILCAQKAGLHVLYCIGETSDEQARWDAVLTAQLTNGLRNVDKHSVVIAYEPVWSIGPGKTPADKPYIEKVARLVKEVTGGMDVIYGGGLKSDNAEMLASIPEVDGGLIALTRFSREIGFYPEEYLEIIERYLKERRRHSEA